jgi:LmbE family N-acetylglucosaminyl deacetylase
MKALAFSPHFDDIVWSAGAHLYGIGQAATVVTVFAKRPPAGLLTAFDRQCGFTGDSHDAMATRRRENIRACTVLDVNDLDGPFGDSQYGDATSEDDITQWASALIRDHGYDTVITPLGIGHPDHRISAAGIIVAARRHGTNVTIYEEIPGRVWNPPEAVDVLAQRVAGGWAVTPTALNTPDDDAYAAKAAAAECYGSQVDPPIRRVLAVPERLWDLKWTG